jgi:UDP-3-O-[3-hydroxymyristoyl] glucosamine N-acyltransferase
MKSLRLSEIAEIVGGDLVGTEDPLITGVAGIEHAGPGDLTFLSRQSLVRALASSGAAAVLIGPDLEVDLPAIRVAQPYEAFALYLGQSLTDLDRVFPPGIHPTVVVDPAADVTGALSIGPYSVIGPGTVVGAGSRLGAHVVLGSDITLGTDCRVYAGVTMREGCQVGNRVIIHAGVILGSDGFGYYPGSEGICKIPQIGIVEIQDDVEIGAGACIDRATTGRTVVGAGSKVDNLVQIGHNVVLGKACSLSAQTGVSGSSTLGDGVMTGGQVGVGDHLKVGAGAKVGGQSGITRDVPAGQSVFGTPAIEVGESFRLFATLRKLPELLRRVKRLEQKNDSGPEGGRKDKRNEKGQG